MHLQFRKDLHLVNLLVRNFCNAGLNIFASPHQFLYWGGICALVRIWQ